MSSLVQLSCGGHSHRRPESPSAEDAIERLKQGNLNYLVGCSSEMDQARRAAQHPQATIVTCSFSCVAPGVITHKNAHGETFVVTSSGHLPGPSLLASVNYGVHHLGTPLVMVVSHRCQRGGACRVPFADSDGLRSSHGTMTDVQHALEGTGAHIELLSTDISGIPEGTLEHDLGTARQILDIPEVREQIKEGKVMVMTAFFNDPDGKLVPTSRIFASSPDGSAHPAQRVVDSLLSGNKRFQEVFAIYERSGRLENTPLIAMVLACSDSREVPEMMFQAPYGSVEVVRNAGASATADALRSFRICHEHTGCNLLVIKPHSRCGAIEATRGSTDDGSAAGCAGSALHITRAIRPHLEAGGWAHEHPLGPKTPETEEARNLESYEAALMHGVGTLREILGSTNEDARYLTQKVREGKLRIAVAVARFGTGLVDFVVGEDLKMLAEIDGRSGTGEAANA